MNRASLLHFQAQNCRQCREYHPGVTDAEQCPLLVLLMANLDDLKPHFNTGTWVESSLNNQQWTCRRRLGLSAKPVWADLRRQVLWFIVRPQQQVEGTIRAPK